MKKTIFALVITFITISAKAQWTDNGNNLTTSDNVGIGTTSPSLDLEIAPTAHRPTIWLNSRGTGNSLNTDIFFGDNGSKRWSITHRPYDQNNDFVIWRRNGSWSKALTINYSNGLVGIGTDAPSSELEVKSVSGNNSEIHINTTSDGGRSILRFQDAGTETWGFLSNYPQSGKFSLYNYQNTSNALVLDSNGNLGIGTTSPSKLLDVNGDARIGNLNSRHYLKISSSEWSEIRFETPTSSEQMRLGTAHMDYANYGVEEGDLYVYTQTTGKMPFVIRRNGDLRFNLKGGNVGIGTASTGSHRLAVEGSIGAREIKVEASGWSDFVFENDYDLRTLEEVEEHIKEKGHLPEIPSQAEVTENGINLGEMDAKLLQKIEELTLYLIEQNKKIEELTEKVQSLENK
ncbi:MAG: hypothetical protein RLN90_14555 [Balneolaceae bacterium]